MELILVPLLKVYRPLGLKQGFEIIDTPGLFGTKEKEIDGKDVRFSEITERYLSQAHIILYLTGAVVPIKDSHSEVLKHILRDLNKLDSTIFVINKMDEAMGKMEISLKDIGSFVLDVGSTALVGACFGPLGAVAGAFIGAMKHLLFSDGGKSQARLEIEKSLEDSKGKNKYLLDQIIHKITNQVDRERNNIVNQIRKEKSNLLELSEIVGKTQIFLRSYINQLKY